MESFFSAGYRFARALSHGRFYLGLAIGAILAALAWGTAFKLSEGIPLSIRDRNVGAWYHVKTAIAEKVQGPGRIVLVGGSNVLYGIAAAQIEKETGAPTVNFGTNAGLNLDYVLVKALSQLRSGDTLLLSLEWEWLRNSPVEIDKFTAAFISGCDPVYLNKQPLQSQISVAMGSGWDRILLPFRVSDTDSSYIQKSFDQSVGAFDLNERGDFIQNRPADQADWMRAAIDSSDLSSSLIVAAQTDRKDPVWQRLAKFLRACEKKGVQVWITFPSFMDTPGCRTVEAQKVYKKTEVNYQKLGAKILTTQKDTLYPKSYFFDTHYHLNSDGRAVRTRLIIDALIRAGAVKPAKPH